MKAKTIRQKIVFNAGPHDVYELLMNSKRHTALTGSSARISRKVGGSFSVYDDYASGKNCELVPDSKIVQTWRASDWEPNHFSTVTIVLSPTSTGCTLRFTQESVPITQYKSIKEGWNEFYWVPMKEILSKK